MRVNKRDDWLIDRQRLIDGLASMLLPATMCGSVSSAVTLPVAVLLTWMTSAALEDDLTVMENSWRSKSESFLINANDVIIQTKSGSLRGRRRTSDTRIGINSLEVPCLGSYDGIFFLEYNSHQVLLNILKYFIKYFSYFF